MKRETYKEEIVNNIPSCLSDKSLGIDSVKILNLEILNISETSLLKQLEKGVLFTPNLDHLVRLQRDREFYNVYKKAEWVVCDSRVLFFLAKCLKHSILEPIPGSSFFKSFYLFHKDDKNCKIFLMGAKEGIAVKAMDRINSIVGREIVVGAHSPSFGFEHNEAECKQMIDIVNNSGATVLLVGVGSPKQEKWIMKFREKMPGVKLFMALGATIDFEAGTLSRAPKFMQQLGLEWLYRVWKEPRRLFHRYFVDDLMFFYYFTKQIIGRYQDPYATNFSKTSK